MGERGGERMMRTGEKLSLLASRRARPREPAGARAKQKTKASLFRWPSTAGGCAAGRGRTVWRRWLRDALGEAEIGNLNGGQIISSREHEILELNRDGRRRVNIS